MALTFQQYTADGVGRTYTVPFPYISTSHVRVKRNGTLLFQPDYEWVSAGSIRLRETPAAGELIEIRRATPIDAPLVAFQNGAVLTEAELNLAVQQNLYLTQEVVDYYESSLSAGLTRIADAGGAIGATVTELIDAATQEILNSSLAAALQASITDIGANAESILEQAQRLTVVESAIDALTGDGGGVITLITNEQNARISGDNALVDTIALIGAKSGDNTSFILDLDTVKVGASESLATRLSYLTAQDGANAATAASILNMTASPTSALLSSISTLQTTVGGHTASISTIQSTTNGLAAQYMVKLDVNGHVSGFGLHNEAGSSSFIVNASKFAVTDGTSSKVPFIVSGGVCYMQNVVIQDALIANLTVGKLTAGTLTAAVTQNADWSIGTGRIIADNGTRKRVMGVGFGVGSAFADWYGPSATAIGSISATGAVFYIKTDGTAYFNGVLGPAATGSIPAPAAFSASNSTDDASYSGGNYGLQSGTVTVTPSGGASPYKYRWTVVPRPGYTLNIFCNSPSTAATTFGSTGTNTEGEIGAYCTVTDANGRVAVTNVVTIHATHGTPP